MISKSFAKKFNLEFKIEVNNFPTQFFPCLTGLRQGDNLFPFLFSIFLNDLEDFFRQLDGEPLKIIQEKLF
jgi:hypothetical protein